MNMTKEIKEFANNLSREFKNSDKERITLALEQIYAKSKDLGLLEEGGNFSKQFKATIVAWMVFLGRKLKSGKDVLLLNIQSYDNRAKNYYENQQNAIKNHAKINELVAGWLIENLSPDSNILDAGCGDGMRTNEIQGLLKDCGINPINFAFDISSKMVTLAKDKDIKHVEVGDLRKIPFKTSFDAITCLNGTLGHLKKSDRDEGLIEIYKHITPGGVFIVDVFNRGNKNKRTCFTTLAETNKLVIEVLQEKFPEIKEECMEEGDLIYFHRNDNNPCFIHNFTKEELVK